LGTEDARVGWWDVAQVGFEATVFLVLVEVRVPELLDNVGFAFSQRSFQHLDHVRRDAAGQSRSFVRSSRDAEAANVVVGSEALIDGEIQLDAFRIFRELTSLEDSGVVTTELVRKGPAGGWVVVDGVLDWETALCEGGLDSATGFGFSSFLERGREFTLNSFNTKFPFSARPGPLAGRLGSDMTSSRMAVRVLPGTVAAKV
jgi:hypothetical protein